MDLYDGLSLALQGVVLIVATVAAVIYLRQLKAMERQIIISRGQQNRDSHQQLVALAIGNDDVIEVWRASHPGMSAADMRRHLFVNLAVSNLETGYMLGRLSEEQVGAALRVHTDNPYYRAFWKEASATREEFAQHDPRRLEYHRLCDRLFGGPDLSDIRPH